MENKVNKEVWFDLSDAQIAEKAREAAKVSKEVGDLEAEAKDTSASYKSRISKKELEVRGLMQVINAGKESRYCFCDMEKNFERNVVQFYFEGKLVEERAMTHEERQLEMQVNSVV